MSKVIVGIFTNTYCSRCKSAAAEPAAAEPAAAEPAAAEPAAAEPAAAEPAAAEPALRGPVVQELDMTLERFDKPMAFCSMEIERKWHCISPTTNKPHCQSCWLFGVNIFNTTRQIILVTIWKEIIKILSSWSLPLQVIS